METHYFDCVCGQFNHVFRFTLEHDSGDLILDVQLRHWEKWYKRVWNALKYVFNKQVKYGFYDTTMLREEDYDRLRDLMKQAEIARTGAIMRHRGREQQLNG